ncbi:hypothetical protein B0A52_04671 [Exophiala mesophila]|uniref:Ubiquitin-like domain-containing protein n=1 Tax=Exophiala mesophila TaxID=212818 RepID=A0A438N8G6_EXOME|nr:hypothetical protein B0A52_04671 [Exophiala mesophila]
MATNNHHPPSTTPPSTNLTPPLPTSSPPPDHVNLRVTYLLTGNPRPPFSLGSVPLSTTVADLKSRIQAELPERPPPTQQRLIYQGRPLLRAEDTLSNVLRIDPGTPTGPLPYTLHIIIQSPQPPSQPSAPPQQSNSSNNAPPTHQPNQRLPGLVAAVEHQTNNLQDALSRIQQSIESNRADLRSVQQRIAVQQHQHQHRVSPIPPNLASTQPTPAQQAQIHQPSQTGLPPRSQLPHILQHHGLHNLYRPQPLVPGSETVTPSNPQVQEFVGPNGERMTVMTDHTSIRIPLPRPASAPGQPAASQSSAAPNSRSSPSVPPPPRAPMAPHAPQWPQMPHLQQAFPASLLHAHLAPLLGQQLPSSQPQNTIAWLLSSPSGPEALVFAPGHGYFTSSTTMTNLSHEGNRTNNTSHVAPEVQSVNNQPDPTGRQAVAANPERAVVPQDPRPGPLRRPQGQEANADDMFGFLIQRIWLFLRLYLFMFVFSEPGSWKRWAMILVATIVCLQPRNGPLTRALAAARQHMDNLIGPPRPQDQARGPARRARPRRGPTATDHDAGETPAQRPANVRGALQITPQEAAARLLREHAEQTPSVWRNALYRVEQSAALFLASLIPGVGERHVRAREDARREIRRLEEERARADEEAAAHAQQESSNTTSLANDQQPEHQTGGGDEILDGQASHSKSENRDDNTERPGISSGVEITDSTANGGELRSRTEQN